MKLAIFDFDGTLFPEETVPFLVKHYGKLGYSRVRQGKIVVKMLGILAAYKMNIDPNMTKERFRGRATQIILTLFDGMTETEVNVFFSRLNEEVFVMLDDEVTAELRKLKDEDYKIVLLSGGFMPLIGPIGALLGVDEVIGTSLNYKKNDKGEQIIQPYEPVHIVSGINKIRALEKAYKDIDVDWSHSYAFADSVYDQDVLKKVGNPVAVNPDQGLKDLCEDFGWSIMQTKAGAILDGKTLSSK